MQDPERFTPLRLHTLPYASTKCLPAILTYPPVEFVDQLWAYDLELPGSKESNRLGYSYIAHKHLLPKPHYELT